MIIKERINTEELLKSLQELLAIESMARRDQEKPFGNGVAQALDYTLSLCQRMGFHTKNADGLYGYAEIGEGAEIIGCLGHLRSTSGGGGSDRSNTAPLAPRCPAPPGRRKALAPASPASERRSRH